MMDRRKRLIATICYFTGIGIIIGSTFFEAFGNTVLGIALGMIVMMFGMWKS
jgi:ACR3 family arsenite efflux pump ArsB